MKVRAEPSFTPTLVGIVSAVALLLAAPLVNSMASKPKVAVILGAIGAAILLNTLIIYGAYWLLRNLDIAPAEEEKTPLSTSSKKDVVSPKEAAPSEKEFQPSTARKGKDRSGLSFREVPSRDIGIPVPDTFMVDFGTNVGVFPRTLLEKQVPFERLTGIKFPGDLQLRIFFDKQGELKVGATVYDQNGAVGAVIKASNFSVLNAKWDRNWDRVAFEIVDERRVPFFQIERPRENLIRLRGIFRTSAGSLIVSSDSGLVLNPTRPVPAPVPLFAYPSTSNLHKRLRALK